MENIPVKIVDEPELVQAAPVAKPFQQVQEEELVEQQDVPEQQPPVCVQPAPPTLNLFAAPPPTGGQLKPTLFANAPPPGFGRFPPHWAAAPGQQQQPHAGFVANAHWAAAEPSAKPENIDETPFRGRQLRAERFRFQRSLTPGYQQHLGHQHGRPNAQPAHRQPAGAQKQVKKVWPQNVLRAAASHAGLETCQNAMVRQKSSHDLHRARPHNREAQVNV